MKYHFIILLCVFFAAVDPALSQPLVQPPKADRLESERLFTQAYKLLSERDYWKAEDLVDLSLVADPYHIDGYLLRALIRQRKGFSGGAVADLKSYLEVRPRDHTASKIISGLEKTSSDFMKIAQTSYSGFKRPLKLYFELPPAVLTGTLGLTYGDAVGNKVALSDSLADQVQVLGKGERRNIPFKTPSDVFFLDKNRLIILGKEGNLGEFEDQGDSFTQLRSSDVGEGADSIAFLSASIFAVSFPFERKIKFLSYPSLELLDSWSPKDHVSFEPRGLSARGGMLAVADRRGDKVFLLPWDDFDANYYLDVSAPRSLVWGSTGDLVVLSDEGFYSIFARDTGNKMTKVDTFPSLEEICLLKNEDQIFSISSDGRFITVLETSPGDKEGIVTDAVLFNPITESINEDRGQAVEVSISLNSAFPKYLYSQRGVLSSVWQDTMKGGRIQKKEISGLNGVIISSENRYKFDGDLWASLEEGKDLEGAVKKIWTKNSFLSQIVLDSGITLTKDDYQWIFSFCSVNGVSLSAWASKIPSDYLISAVENTGGNVYYSESLLTKNLNDMKTRNFIIKIFYPDTVYSSGYPSKNMLSIIADFGMISYRGWLPIWPDMLRQ